ncbi:hypothetical protein VZQ01_08330 [Myxococcus faecalis]|uniref:hypothetical protein n=1 Tax=Myxococcus faecalis TaxID=3115646 RepID=UPI003CE70585
MSEEREQVAGRLSVIKERMTKALKGFKSGLPEGVDEWELSSHSPDQKLFPVPELVLFGLRNVMGFEWTGKGEKVRWTVRATVDGEPFAFAWQKFGFRILARREVAPDLLKRVAGQLSGSLKYLEPTLNALAEAQIDEGNLTLENRMSLHEDRYRYFRDLADKAFRFKPRAGRKKPADDMAIFADMTEGMNRLVDAERRGFFASGAMVDAWFSGLEHRMLLLRAFLGRPLAKGSFRAFLSAKWRDRLIDLHDGVVDAKLDRLLMKLCEVKETIRNPLAHGGVENDGGAFHFHLPSVGAVPANLSRNRGRLKMSFFPIEAGSHAETCKLFDAADEHLSMGMFKLPNEFIRWGIDPRFDQDALSKYGIAIAEGEDAVKALIDRLNYEWERHANMDY